MKHLSSRRSFRTLTATWSALVVVGLVGVVSGSASAIGVTDLSVRPGSSPCTVTISVSGADSVNVTLHVAGGSDQTIGEVFPGVPLGVPVITCSSSGSSASQLVYVTGSDSDPDLSNNVAFV
ncbi:hypothetical protein [Williamsia sp. CHRR-6]|uniref:hypothetical protein n=1 Tax=Williamsia sp. CHRR-6 TaxID=2835871 RepID=UPI001BD9E77A|nr:hypothetical protein [Williamsia sp. CHRR-6]MBT0565718.1 hypothetical protein [Williamsia sp. CHRR-6]